MKNFRDKVVTITGAGSGIGRALAQAFGQRGARLALSDRDEATLAETVSQLALPAARVQATSLDVSDRAAVLSYADQVVDHFGAVDVVINNAGLSIAPHPLTQLDLDDFERVMRTNFGGVLHGSKAFLPYLEQQPEAALVNVASVYGLTGIRQVEAYVASKFAVSGLTLSLMHTYRGTPLQVHCVYPGGIKTNIARNALHHDQRNEVFEKQFRHTPQYAAKTILRGIRKNQRRILIGSEAYVLDYLTRLSPVGGSALVDWYVNPLFEAYHTHSPDYDS